MIEFKMPSLGADMEAGTLIEWLKKPGDAVERGDIIAVVDTQKSAIEIEVFAKGIIESLLVKAGQRVPVGTVMAMIREPSEAAGEGMALKTAQAAPKLLPPVPAQPVTHVLTQPVMAGEGLRATPAARRKAAGLALDLSKVPPGKDGVVGLSEVEAALRGAQPGKVTRTGGISFEEMRKAIGAAMARSHREIPHYYVSATLNLSRLMTWLETENARRPVPERLLYAAPVIRAVALALKKSSELNGRYVDGRFQPAGQVNLGVAIAMRGGGLIAPAILKAETLDVVEIMGQLRELAGRVRGGRLRNSQMTDGTVTLSSLGEGTADVMMPLIYPPQVAIIGCGQIAERPWIADGRVVPARLMTVTVAGDHRVSDGRSAATFLNNLDKLLQSPETL